MSAPASPTPRRGVLAAALAAGSLGGCTTSRSGPVGGSSTAPQSSRADETTGAVGPFRAARQPGIRGRVQPFAAFVALDLLDSARRSDLRRLLRIWSSDIERLMAGHAPLTDPEPELARHTAGLSVTVGVGARPVRVARGDKAVPAWLGPLPAYPIDKLRPDWSAGDLLLQICADSPTTVAHALRRLSVGVRDIARIRWVQRGFREPLDTGEGLIGMRNLFGQVDGTINPVDDEPVFIAADGPDWLREGSSVVIRRIRMDLDAWEGADRPARENALGRRLRDGAPVTGGRESDIPDLEARDPLGFHVVDDAAHVRRAQPGSAAERFLRRPYSYDEGGDPSDAGLIFTAYQADPLTQFHPVQQRLAEKDLMNIWTTPIGSSVFALLPGIGSDEHLGAALLA